MNDAYLLRPFRVKSVGTLCDIICAFPLATLISGAAGNASMTLIPLLVRQGEGGRITLSGHLDRNNAQSRAIEPGVAISFQVVGPNSYASPDLYADPQLPGWLYVSVQGDGVVSEVLDGPDTRALLIEATKAFGGPDQSFSLDAEDPRIAMFLPGIKAFNIDVTRISGIAKLAQDKGPGHARIASDFLAGQDNSASAGLFQKLLRETL